MNVPPNPDERFKDLESTWENLSNSFRHLLTAQVIMNDWQQPTQKLIEQLAEQAVQSNQRLDRLAQKVESLADGQKHTDAKLDALTDLVRN